MKVKVEKKYVKPQTKTIREDLASAYEEIERLFQENKDLRVREGHTQDEFNQLKSRFATACADRDNWQASFKQMTGWWEEATAAKVKVEDELKSTQIELKDREERVFILEQRIQSLERENAELRETAATLTDKLGQYEKTTTFVKLRDAQDEVSHLRAEVARLTVERDTAIRENTTIIFRISDLEDELEAATNIKNDYAEQIDTLTKERNALARKANDTTAGFWNFLVEHNLVKTEEELGGGNIHEAEH